MHVAFLKRRQIPTVKYASLNGDKTVSFETEPCSKLMFYPASELLFGYEKIPIRLFVASEPKSSKISTLLK